LRNRLFIFYFFYKLLEIDMKLKRIVLISLLIFLSLSTTYFAIQSYTLQNQLTENSKIIREKEITYNKLKERYIQSLKARSKLSRRLSNLYDEYYSLLAEYKALKNILSELSKNCQYREITYNELLLFLKDDKTDEKVAIFKNLKYVCIDFAIDLRKNAHKLGIKCGIVLLYFESGAHSINVFSTTDRGLIFVEPQDDTVFTKEQLIQYWSRFERLLRIIIIW